MFPKLVCCQIKTKIGRDSQTDPSSFFKVDNIKRTQYVYKKMHLWEFEKKTYVHILFTNYFLFKEALSVILREGKGVLFFVQILFLKKSFFCVCFLNPSSITKLLLFSCLRGMHTLKGFDTKVFICYQWHLFIKFDKT